MDNVYEFHNSQSIEEAAAIWLIKLESDQRPTHEELQAFQQWLEQSPAHQSAFKRLSTFWDDEAVLAELAIPLQPPAKHSPVLFSRWITFPWSLARVSLVASVLVVGILLVLSPAVFKAEQCLKNCVYQTKVGEQQVHTLADGSVLSLNTNTHVRVDYSDKQRKIRLLKGEAHFDVQSDSSRPFEVYAGQGMVRAVGTAFSVYLTPRNVEVTVTEGRVDLSAIQVPQPSPGQSVPSVSTTDAKLIPKKLGTLDAGQSAVFDSAVRNIKHLAELEVTDELSWRSGLLVFKGEPLIDVVREINRYTSITIEILDPALRQLEIGGRFKVSEIEGIFDVLEANFGVEVSRLSDQHIQLQLEKSNH
jgi:transmembrane sensor